MNATGHDDEQGTANSHVMLAYEAFEESRASSSGSSARRRTQYDVLLGVVAPFLTDAHCLW